MLPLLQGSKKDKESVFDSCEKQQGKCEGDLMKKNNDFDVFLDLVCEVAKDFQGDE